MRFVGVVPWGGVAFLREMFRVCPARNAKESVRLEWTLIFEEESGRNIHDVEILMLLRYLDITTI